MYAFLKTNKFDCVSTSIVFGLPGYLDLFSYLTWVTLIFLQSPNQTYQKACKAITLHPGLKDPRYAVLFSLIIHPPSPNFLYFITYRYEQSYMFTFLSSFFHRRAINIIEEDLEAEVHLLSLTQMGPYQDIK